MGSQSVVDIWEGRDFFTPAFELKLGGRNADKQLIHDVTEVSYRDSIDELASCELTVNTWDAEKRGYQYLDDGTFDPGTPVQLKMGYRDGEGLETMLEGAVSSVSVDFPGAGAPTMRVRAVSELKRLYLQQKTKVFEGATDAEVAEALLDEIQRDSDRRASDQGITPVQFDLETAGALANRDRQQRYVFVENEYPVVFLMRLARRNGCDLYLEQDDDADRFALHFHPPSTGLEAQFELTRGKSLIDFQLDLETSRQLDAVEVRGWDPHHKQAISAEVTLDDLDVLPFADADDLAAVHRGVEGAREVSSDEPVRSVEQARQVALGKLEQRVKQMVTGSGSTVGVPGLRAGRPVYIKGLGERYSGRWFITSTTHSIGSSGYQTQFEVRKEEKQ